MNAALRAVIALAVAGCGGLLAPVPGGSGDGGLGDGSSSSSPDGQADGEADAGSRGPAPVPVCSSANGICVRNGPVAWTGAAVVNCNPVDYVGPWNLTLERQIGGQFVVVQTQAVQEPGFGATFNDTSAPIAQEGALYTYEVCATDGTGTKCGTPFTSIGAPECGCNAFSCQALQVCNTTIDDGCGRTVTCGACPDNGYCDPTWGSCCPPGFYGNGAGGCVCAPPKPCRQGTWDPSQCDCSSM